MPTLDWSELAPTVRDHFERTDALLRELESADMTPVFEWLERLRGQPLDHLPRIPRLEHRLSGHIAARSHSDPFHPRTKIETGVFEEACERVGQALLGPEARFMAHLAEVHTLICRPEDGLRDAGVYSMPDRLGNFVVFPDVQRVEPGLRHLWRFLAEVSAPATYRAAVAMVSICNLHPFKDGNGRVSRLVFNALLKSELALKTYVPLHELGRISRGSLLVAMRMAQYRADWTDMGKFLLNSSSFMLAASREPAILSFREAR